MTVLYNVNQMAGDLYIEMETDVFFDIKMVTTDKTQRRGGLATDLLRRSVELARNLGFKAVKTEATGMYVLVMATSSGILKAKQKLARTFNSDKLGGIAFTKISKLTMCSA